MIAVLGDVEDMAPGLIVAHDRAVAAGAAALIQTGDLTLCRAMRTTLLALEFRPSIPVYVIDGNHDDFRWMREELVSESHCPPLVPGVRHVPRGTVLTIDGRRVGFLGGAAAITYRQGEEGVDWFRASTITAADVARFAGQGPVDLLVTHTPPQRVLDTRFSSAAQVHQRMLSFGVDASWRDPSATYVEQAWHALGYPPVVCGHMHCSLSTMGVRILDECELLLLDAPEDILDAPSQPSAPDELRGTDEPHPA
jgi:predicted phosphodiesterase